MVETIVVEAMMVEAMMVEAMMVEAIVVEAMMVEAMMVETIVVEAMKVEAMMVEAMMVEAIVAEAMMVEATMKVKIKRRELRMLNIAIKRQWCCTLCQCEEGNESPTLLETFKTKEDTIEGRAKEGRRRERQQQNIQYILHKNSHRRRFEYTHL